MDYSAILERLPPETAPLIRRWTQHQNVDIKLKPSRQSKLGDFRAVPRQRRALITLNRDLGPYHMLITLTHELAHASVWSVSKRAKPHGRLWKQTFGNLLRELSQLPSLPAIFRQAVVAHAKSPPASTARDPNLLAVLRRLDDISGTALDELSAGEGFTFRGHHFVKLGTSRTRCKCRRTDNHLIYTIPRQALIEPEARVD